MHPQKGSISYGYACCIRYNIFCMMMFNKVFALKLKSMIVHYKIFATHVFNA